MIVAIFFTVSSLYYPRAAMNGYDDQLGDFRKIISRYSDVKVIDNISIQLGRDKLFIGVLHADMRISRLPAESDAGGH
jgi:hypothetical protein